MRLAVRLSVAEFFIYFRKSRKDFLRHWRETEFEDDVKFSI